MKYFRNLVSHQDIDIFFFFLVLVCVCVCVCVSGGGGGVGVGGGGWLGARVPVCVHARACVCDSNF